ncbi:unnamed protein product [Xylocopa violacea]|uniref:Guanylate cyclase domain-containing protein n=1 Tax=Xylocopa violacea TaxID=135666 RepID=A0ABP1NQ08_XYLVO
MEPNWGLQSSRLKTAWTPDVIGPIYKHHSLNLREVLLAHRNDKCTRTMATFVPDELIYEKDLTTKNFRKFNAVLLLINMVRFFNVSERYASAENGGSHALFTLLNDCVNVIIEEVYTNEGDVLKLSLEMVVSTGEVTFSVIGDDRARQYIISGTPIEDVKFAKRICLPGDLVLTSSAWAHCAPTLYEYVIKDSSNVKIIKVIGPPAESPRRSVASFDDSTIDRRQSVGFIESDLTLLSDISTDPDINLIQFQTRISVVDALRRGIGEHLKTYMLKPVLTQIEHDDQLKYLTEVREITVICISVVPFEYTVDELISLVDELYKIMQNIIEQYSGSISMVNLFEKDISFYILYGIRDYNDKEEEENNSKSGLLSAYEIMEEIKHVSGVKAVLIGVSTGIAFCGIIGHIVRMQYMVFGVPVNKAISLMTISYDKISCDYDTLLKSTLNKNRFRSRGVKVLRRFGKALVYEFVSSDPKTDSMVDLTYMYPILDRIYELENFNDILDDIGVSGRIYSGLLIEGSERSGKSRLLDAFVTVVLNREIKFVQVPLHPSHVEKPYAVLHNIFLQVIGRVCIILDDVQYIDLLSWQFLSAILKNHNVVLVMTMTQPASRNNLNQVEASIFQDKRLMNKTLEGLTPNYIAAYACQFLGVDAIPGELEKILQHRSRNSIGWCEAFLMSMLQVQALNFITISPAEVSNYDLVFPDQSFLVKIPSYLTPEEVAPPLHWSQMNSLNVCIPVDKPKTTVEINRDLTGLRIDMYNRMNSYEQAFIKCAAAMGAVFPRSNRSLIILSFSIALAVAEMIRLRILECGMIQRKHCHADDSVYHVLKNKKTFSNMHHLVTCACQPSYIFTKRTLPTYAYCKLLEFTMSAYHKLFYEILSPQEKADYHKKALDIYEKDARRCNTCGGGQFLKYPMLEDEEVCRLRAKTTLHGKRDRFESRRSIFVPDSNDPEKRREALASRKVSVLPVSSESDEIGSELSPGPLKDSHFNSMKRTRRLSEVVIDDIWSHRLKQFTYIDYRNCRCIKTISYLFWKLHDHVSHSGDVNALVKFMIEYSSGLIQTGQPLYATKYLAGTTANIGILKMREKLILDSPDAIINKGRSLVLTGDAYVAYGNYSQAQKFYTEAVTMKGEVPQCSKLICCNLVFERIRYRIRSLRKYRDRGSKSVERIERAIYLQRLAMISMLQDETKVAMLTVLRSLRDAFECPGAFTEKGQMYLTALQIFHNSNEQCMIRSLERSMLAIIDRKTNWKLPEEIIMLAHIYQTMYDRRILQGNLDEGIEYGILICKICNCMHLNRIKLTILPTLIEIMIWTKQVNGAVDLLYELYYLAKEDIDYSAITWYYSLCMELMLDAAMILESYETCHDFYVNVMSDTCVLRDPESLSRLTTCLLIWQLRMNVTVTEPFMKEVDEYMDNIAFDKFSQIYNCIKGFESYLLVLKRRINIRKSYDLISQVRNANSILKFLHEAAYHATFIKPFLFLLQSYMEILRGRRTFSRANMTRSHKMACLHGNKLVLAWIEQNKRTWEEGSYNNMAQYWNEHVGSGDGVRWQEIHSFTLNAWSTILFPFPIPDTNY